jgi:drug/metabolite transporter (DMT)-like permease
MLTNKWESVQSQSVKTFASVTTKLTSDYNWRSLLTHRTGTTRLTPNFRHRPLSVRHSSHRAWLQIHLCVVLWGFTAILGKAITLPALPLVWWRMTLVTAALLLVRSFWAGLGKLSPRLVAIYSGIGVLVALHWLSFYSSIKLANASVAATCMALAPVFTAVTEPVFVRRRFDVRELLLGLAVIPGVVLLVGGTPVEMRIGILVGVVAAVFVALFGSLNKRYVESGEVLVVTGLEMGAGAIFLILMAGMLPDSDVFIVPAQGDLILLLVLALICTLLPYALSLVALRHLSAFTTALVVNLEPVYAILLAIVLFGEQRELDATFYGGVVIILAVVFSHPFLASPHLPTFAEAPGAEPAEALDLE